MNLYCKGQSQTTGLLPRTTTVAMSNESTCLLKFHVLLVAQNPCRRSLDFLKGLYEIFYNPRTSPRAKNRQYNKRNWLNLYFSEQYSWNFEKILPKHSEKWQTTYVSAYSSPSYDRFHKCWLSCRRRSILNLNPVYSKGPGTKQHATQNLSRMLVAQFSR